MRKAKDYAFTHFDAETIRAAGELCQRSESKRGKYALLTVESDDAEWHHDNFEEFLADYRNSRHESTCGWIGGATELWIYVHVRPQRHKSGETPWGWLTKVSVTAKDRSTIESVFAIFEAQLKSSQKFPEPKPPPEKEKPTIFIGHGQSRLWRDLKDHLHDLHGYKVEAFETGARAGHAARDVLEEMLNQSSFALLVLTAEDEQIDGTVRARQNVVHECGLFQGRLGFSRAIMLLESGCEEFSNIQGIQQIRFTAGNIKETFGDVLATLRREFED